MSRRATAGAASVFLLLAMVHTWPLITGLNHLSSWNDDEWLNAWAVSWIAHQLPNDPLHLLDANIYYPESQALAYTEPLIVPGVMGAPLRWLGASPLFTYNVLVLLGFTLTALAMCRRNRRPRRSLHWRSRSAFNASQLPNRGIGTKKLRRA